MPIPASYQSQPAAPAPAAAAIAPPPFLVVLDEYGFYADSGLCALMALARSSGFIDPEIARAAALERAQQEGREINQTILDARDAALGGGAVKRI